MFETLLAHPAANALGALGMAMGILWPFFRARTAMLAVQVLGGSFFACHFFLIGAPTGAAMNLLGALQALLAIPLGTRPGFRVIYLISLPLIAAGLILTWTGLPSILAGLALALVSIGRYQTRLIPFRALLAGSIPLWFAHNFLVGSVPGMCSDLLSGTSGLVALGREIRRARLDQAVSPSSSLERNPG